MTPDTMFITGNAVHGRHGIKAREAHSKPRIANKIAHAGQIHNVIYGRYDDNRIAEVLLEGADDTAGRLATMLLQRGVEIETVRQAVGDDTLIAIVLDRLMAINGGPRNASYRWLQKCNRRQSLNRRRTTYSFKRWAEQDEGEYTSVEEFEAAAIKLGFRLERIPGGNCWINIAEPRKTKRL
jgi:hypothetical protein